MNLDTYQKKAVKTAVYPKEYKIVYPALGLAGETGEVCEKIKKVVRDHNSEFSEDKIQEIKKELGDVLWYIANIANDLEIFLEDIAETNIQKLQSRQSRNKLKGEGDNR